MSGSHSNPANHAQIESCKRSIGRALDTFLAEDRRFRDDVINAQARQFMLVKPGISMQEATRMAEDDNGQTQVFQQSIINSDRLGQVNTTRNAVQARSDAIQNIAQTVTEILQLQADLARTVEEQQPYIEKIENNTQEAHENVVVANTQIVGATEKARAARKKKWICLTIVVLLILIVVAIVLAYGATQGGWFKKVSLCNAWSLYLMLLTSTEQQPCSVVDITSWRLCLGKMRRPLAHAVDLDGLQCKMSVKTRR